MSNSRFTEYEKVAKIGEGTYGCVYKVRHRTTGKFFALKTIRRLELEEGIPINALRETSLLRRLKHENVVRLCETRYDAHKGKVRLLMEYVDVDLRTFLDKRDLPPAFIKSLAYQLLSGIDYIHEQSILHWDIKPQNVLIDSQTGALKICDFGLAKPITLPLGVLTTAIQTLYYRAPEILLGVRSYSVGVDVWSAGCIIAEMAIGMPIFYEKSEIGMLFKIFQILGSPDAESSLSSAPYFSPNIPKFKENRLKEFLNMFNVGEDMIDLLMLMLVTDPEKRLTTKAAMSHFFFVK